MGTRLAADATRGRRCLAVGCERRVRPGEAFCKGHGRSEEATAFRRELRGAAAYLDGMGNDGGADRRAAEKRGAAGRRFDLRSRRGEFDRVHAVRGAVAAREEAEMVEVRARVAAAHEAMARALVDEPDVRRMTMALVRAIREAAMAREGLQHEG